MATQEEAVEGNFWTNPSLDSAKPEFEEGWKSVGEAVPIWSDGQKTVTSLMDGDVGAALGSAQAFAGEVMGVAFSDPLHELLKVGLGFLLEICKPLGDALNLVTGDSGALDDAAEAYGKISETLHTLADEMQQFLDDGLESWHGQAADKARDRLKQFIEGVHGTGSEASNLVALLKASSALMEAAQDIIKGIICDFVEWLIITWLAAQAAAVPTLGASEVAAAGATAVNVGVATTRAATQVSRVTGILQKVGKAWRSVAKALKGKETVFRGWGKEFAEYGKGLPQTIADEAKNAGIKLTGKLGDTATGHSQAESEHPSMSDEDIDRSLAL